MFGIGLPKTATTSLHEGFKSLGFKAIGYSDPALAECLSQGYGKVTKNLVSEFDAFSDWPWNLIYRELFSEFGNTAKFILTRRTSAEVWVDSVKRSSLGVLQAENRNKIYGAYFPHGFERGFAEIYEEHLNDVRKFFKYHDAEDSLLELEIGSSGDWEAFTRFLGFEGIVGGFGRENVSNDRDPKSFVTLRNLRSLNSLRRQQGKAIYSLPEALTMQPEPIWRTPKEEERIERQINFVGSLRNRVNGLKIKKPVETNWKKLQRKLTTHKKRETAQSRLTNTVSREVNYAMDIVEEERLFGIDDPMPKNTDSGYRFLGPERTREVLTQTIEAFGRARGVAPNILTPQTFTDFILLYKLFGALPFPAAEDKFSNEAFVPENVKHLLTFHDRPFVSQKAEAPTNDQVPPGYYYWKTNHGFNLMKKVRFPVSDEERTEMAELAEAWLASPGNFRTGQWWNASIKKCVYLERDLSGDGGSADDWKIFVFQGKARLIQVDRDRHTNHSQTIYTERFEHISKQFYFGCGHPVDPPERLEDMLKIAESVGAPYDFLRVDFYCEGGNIYLGELTIVPQAGRVPIRSYEVDNLLGQYWPKNSRLRSHNLDPSRFRATPNDRLGQLQFDSDRHFQ